MWKSLSRRVRRSGNLRRALDCVRSEQERGAPLSTWVDLALDFPNRGDVKVRTVQRRSEILALAEAVSALSPERILEIGTYRGGTLLLWAQIASHRVVSCDLCVKPHLVDLYQSFAPTASECEVTVKLGNTHDADFAAAVAAEFDGPIDFLFIDGDHSTDGVRQDYEEFRGLVRPGGLIAFHDIAPLQPIEGNQVHWFWESLRDSLPADSVHESIEEPGQSGFGIGWVSV